MKPGDYVRIARLEAGAPQIFGHYVGGVYRVLEVIDEGVRLDIDHRFAVWLPTEVEPAYDPADPT
jgi:hypothetical protein